MFNRNKYFIFRIKMNLIDKLLSPLKKELYNLKYKKHNETDKLSRITISNIAPYKQVPNSILNIKTLHIKLNFILSVIHQYAMMKKSSNVLLLNGIIVNYYLYICYIWHQYLDKIYLNGSYCYINFNYFLKNCLNNIDSYNINFSSIHWYYANTYLKTWASIYIE